MDGPFRIQLRTSGSEDPATSTALGLRTMQAATSHHSPESDHHCTHNLETRTFRRASKRSCESSHLPDCGRAQHKHSAVNSLEMLAQYVDARSAGLKNLGPKRVLSEAESSNLQVLPRCRLPLLHGVISDLAQRQRQLSRRPCLANNRHRDHQNGNIATGENDDQEWITTMKLQ